MWWVSSEAVQGDFSSVVCVRESHPACGGDLTRFWTIRVNTQDLLHPPGIQIRLLILYEEDRDFYVHVGIESSPFWKHFELIRSTYGHCCCFFYVGADLALRFCFSFTTSNAVEDIGWNLIHVSCALIRARLSTIMWHSSCARVAWQGICISMCVGLTCLFVWPSASLHLHFSLCLHLHTWVCLCAASQELPLLAYSRLISPS